MRSSIGLSSRSRVFWERCSPSMSFWLHDALECFDYILIVIVLGQHNSASVGFRRSRDRLAWRPIAHFSCAPRFLGFVLGLLFQLAHFLDGLKDKGLIDSRIARLSQTFLGCLNFPATDGRPGTITVWDRDVRLVGWVPKINLTHVARDDSEYEFAGPFRIFRIPCMNPMS